MITINTREATDLLIDCLKSKLVPFVHGSPAIGKSAIIHSIADKFNLEVIDLRLSQVEPVDLLGLPNKASGRFEYLPPAFLPLEGDKLPEGKSGYLLFLDEFNSANKAVMAAAYKLVLDRMVGQEKLHRNVAIICAGNKTTDRAIANELPTALKSRMVHLEVAPDKNVWVEDYALPNRISDRILGYLNFRPLNFYNFDPKAKGYTFPSPRTWEFLDRLLKGWGDAKVTAAHRKLIQGTIGEGPGMEFANFLGLYGSLPTIKEIIAKPSQAKVPDEPSSQYAIASAISSNLLDDSSNALELITYLERLPAEIQVVSLRQAITANKELFGLPAVQQWVEKYKHIIVD